MKSLRTTVGILIVSMGSCGVVRGDSPLPRDPVAMGKVLGLKRNQIRRIAAIDRRYGPKYAAVASRYLPETVALRKRLAELESRYVEEMRPLVARRGAEVDAVLTPSQRAGASRLDAAARARYATARAEALAPSGTKGR